MLIACSDRGNSMLRLFLLWGLVLFEALPLVSAEISYAEDPSPDASAQFAFVDRDYIFTIEVVKPGVPLLNFVSMTDVENRLIAKNIWLMIENRRIAGKLLVVETGKLQQPMIVTSLLMRPRSSFGIQLQGDFGSARELSGVTIRIGNEDFRLSPLTKFDFETLALKVNRLDLGSPDFSDDFRVLNLQNLGSRSPARK